MRITDVSTASSSRSIGDDIPTGLPKFFAHTDTVADGEGSGPERFQAHMAVLRIKIEGARRQEREAEAARKRFEALAHPLLASLRRIEESVALDHQDREFQVDVAAQ